MSQMHLTFHRKFSLASLTFLIVAGCSDTSAPTEAHDPVVPVAEPAFSVGTASVNSNEPSGYTIISDRYMDAKVEAGWTDRGDAAFGISTLTTAPRSPNHIGQALFKKGYKGGSGPISTSLNLRGRNKKHIYVGFWLKLSSSFYGANTSGVNKVFHVWADGISTAVFALYGQGTSAMMPEFRMQQTEADPRGSSFNLTPNINKNIRLVRNRWYHIEFELDANTLGVANGTALWWIDGALVGSYSNVGYLSTKDSPYWEQIQWNPTWGTPSDRVPNDMWMYIDHIYVSAS